MRFSGRFVAAALAGLVWGGAQISSATSVRQIMETMVDPAALFIWRSVSTTVTTEGVIEKFPRTDKEWNDLRRAATRLAEGGALLKKEPREQGNKHWQTWSQSMVDAADATLKGVDARSPNQILMVGEKIYDTCVACHGGYSMMTAP